MKKYIAYLSFSVLLAAPTLALADHNDAHTIEQLQAQIAAIQALMNKFKAQQNIPSTPSSPPLPVPQIPSPPQPPVDIVYEKEQNFPAFNKDLFFGMKNNSDVSDLQEFLADQGYYAGPISGNFGLLTLSSIKKFQSDNGINTTGYFGARSRAAANGIIQKLVGQICPREEGCEGNIVPAARISITSNSDLAGQIGVYFEATFKLSGGSGDYKIDAEDVKGEEAGSGLNGAEPGDFCEKCASARRIPKDEFVIYGMPQKTGIISFTLVAKDRVAATPAYGKQRFTIFIKGDVSSSQPPVISGVKGPTALKVGEEGIWTVNASDSRNSSLSYSVTWGDEEKLQYGIGAPAIPESRKPFIQTATFSHTYQALGVYTAVFRVVSERGQEAKTSLSVNVANNNVDPRQLISERVKCVFHGGGGNINKCYTVDNEGTNGCAGNETCTASITDIRGKLMPWKSSCSSQAVVYTTMDGREEYADFKCGSVTPPKSGFLEISPSYVAPLQVGGSVKLQAIYQPPAPPCPAGQYCSQSMPASYVVPASFGTRDPSIASVNREGKDLQVTVTAKSLGTTEITAEYIPGEAQIVTASIKISVQGGVATPLIQVLSPNGGETWEVGKTYTITYSLADTSAEPLIYLEKGYEPSSGKEGINSSMLIGQPGRGVQSFVYTVPNTLASWPGLGSNFKIKVCANTSCTVNDSSDGWFSIMAAPSIAVISPNGGETFNPGGTLPIRWKSLNTGTLGVSISLLDNVGAISRNIIENTNNTGSFDWIIPQGFTGSFRVSIGTYDKGPSAQDFSDAPFSIVAAGTTGSPTLQAKVSSVYPSGLQIQRGSKDVTVAAFTVSNNSGTAAEVNRLKVVCQGCVSPSPYGVDFSAVKIYDGAILVGSAVPSVAGFPIVEVVLGTRVSVSPYGSKDFIVKADIASSSVTYPATFYVELRDLGATAAGGETPVSVLGLPIYPSQRNVILASSSASANITANSSAASVLLGIKAALDEVQRKIKNLR